MKSRNTIFAIMSLCLSASAFAAGKAQYVTECSGKDSKNNEITIKLVDLGIGSYDKDQLIMVIDLDTSRGNYHYNVTGADVVESVDVVLDVKSKDNEGITLNTDGSGELVSGRIGILGSTFNLRNCTPGPAAP